MLADRQGSLADRDDAATRPPTIGCQPRRVVHHVNRLLERRPRLPIDADGALDAARRQTGLDDVGDPTALVALRELCRSLEVESDLTPIGRWLARAAVHTSLVNRLEIVDLCHRQPAILDRPVRAPIVIAAPPRTGTTLLHRLLATDPALRAPRYFEMAQPCTGPGRIERADHRQRDAERSLRVLRWLVPDFRAIHDFQADGPEECVMMMGNDLVSFTFAIQFWVPSYWSWLEGLDLTCAYENHRRQLQILQGPDPARWVLKAPAHLMALRPILDAYPDAVVVQTHRDRATALASALSLLASSHSLTSRQVDVRRLSARLEQSFDEWTRRFNAHRTAARATTFVDLRYEELVADPIGALRAVRAAAGLDTPTDVLAAARGYLDRHPQDRHGRHRYRVGAPLATDHR